MTTTEQYTIYDIIQMIKEDKLRLPTFQRNYVWEKTDIVKLFSTLFSDNTFGAISAIKTTMGYPIFSTRSFIDDLRDKYQLMESNFTPNYTSDDPLYLILDGQQRLQSFYLAFDGDFDKEDLFFNTEDCTVAFYETSPNNNWIPIKKLYNKMSRVSYEQTAKYFGKEKNENIFKFFYHIFFTKRITFLISEPSNELEKDKDRFTNLFIKVNTSGKGLDKWETYRCIITGMRPETTEMFSKLTLFINKTKKFKEQYQCDAYIILNIIYYCLLNITQSEYDADKERKMNVYSDCLDWITNKITLNELIAKQILLDACPRLINHYLDIWKLRLSEDKKEELLNAIMNLTDEAHKIFEFTEELYGRVKFITRRIDENFSKNIPEFIEMLWRLNLMMGLASFYSSDIIISLYRAYKKNCSNFNLRTNMVDYIFKKINHYFIKSDDCLVYIYVSLTHLISNDLYRDRKDKYYNICFDAGKQKDMTYKLFFDENLSSELEKDEKEYICLFPNKQWQLWMGVVGTESVEEKCLYCDINEAERERREKEFIDVWQKYEEETNKKINKLSNYE